MPQNSTGLYLFQTLALRLSRLCFADISIATLHERHFAVTAAASLFMAEAAVVTLQQTVPLKKNKRRSAAFAIETQDLAATLKGQTTVRWPRPTQQEIVGHKEIRRTIENAACGFCLAALEAKLGLFAYARLDRPDSADYAVATVDDAKRKRTSAVPNLEGATFLEISGIRRMNYESVQQRVTKKESQVRAYRKGIVAVCGFQEQKLAIKIIDNSPKP